MLEALNLTKSFIGPPAVDSVSFTIRPGEILGYLGPNGAGKSTTVKMLIGLLRPSRGQIRWQGEDIQPQLLDYQRRYGTAEPAENSPRRDVRLTLSDGSEFPEHGRINFADRALDSTTGTYTLRAEFPNPGHSLVPGLFARIRITAEIRNNAIVVPDRAVQQQLGRYFVTAVGKDNKAEARPVQLGPRLGSHWIIEGGVRRGDKLVVEGLQKALPGTPLNPTVITESELQNDAAPPPAAG